MGEHLSDVALAEDILRDSGLDWTVVRPPPLTDKPLTGTYRIAYDKNVCGGFPSHALTPHIACSARSANQTRSSA